MKAKILYYQESKVVVMNNIFKAKSVCFEMDGCERTCYGNCSYDCAGSCRQGCRGGCQGENSAHEGICIIA